MILGVYWDGTLVGQLKRESPTSREYWFEYADRTRPLSLSLPTDTEVFTPAESRPFFEGVLPEGGAREQIATQLKLGYGDSYGLLAALGRDCAGALQVVESARMSEPRSVRWLDGDALDKHIAELPTRPLGVRPEDERLRLSLAGVQRKAVLVRDGDGRFGEPLNGMPSTHILKPDLPGSEYPAIAVNEYFCMRLAAVCRLPTAEVELLTIAGRPCLVVTRFDRDTSVDPARRLHQEDLCQALGITPDFKYQQADWRLPSFKALADLLDAHGTEPGRDRLAVADGAVFNVLIGNSDAHAKNMSLLHQDGGRVRLAPFYDLVSTAAYPQLRTELGLAIGDELEPDAIGAMEWDNFAADVGLGARAFARRRAVLAATVARAARAVRDEARAEGWHDPVVDTIVDVIDRRVEVVTAR